MYNKLSIYEQENVINYLSSYLTGYVRRSSNLHICRCPLCGDSHKSLKKKRGYFYTKGDDFYYVCHNCGYHKSLKNFCYENYKGVYEQFFKTTLDSLLKPVKTTFTAPKQEIERTITSKFGIDIKTLLNTPNHPAIQYLDSRKLPYKNFDLLWIDSVKDIGKQFKKYENTWQYWQDSQGIGIPFYDFDKQMAYLQVKLLQGSIKYITFEIIETDFPKLWGVDKVDFTKPVYIFEGVFDAMCVQNSLAVAGASLNSLKGFLSGVCKGGYTFVFDSDYKSNYSVLEQVKKAVQSGTRVVLYDAQFPFKDFNDAVKAGWSIAKCMEYISKHTYDPLTASMKLASIKPLQNPFQKFGNTMKELKL